MAVAQPDLPAAVAIALLEAQLQASVVQDDVGAISVGCVAPGGNLIRYRAFGWKRRSAADGTPWAANAGPDTIFRIGSISKSATCVALMLTVEAGLLSLDDTADQIVPEVTQIPGYADHAPFTLRQLASHTSGLDREPALPDCNIGSVQEWEEVTTQSISTSSYAFEPGTSWKYCNIGYAILGLAVARAARAAQLAPSLEALLEEQVFAPLGMCSTGYTMTTADRAIGGAAARGFVQQHDGTWSDELPTAEEDGRGYRVPNGGLYSTVRDLGRYIGMLSLTASSTVLTAESLAEMRKPLAETQGASAGTGTGQRYGLGLFTTPDGQIAYHGGATPGFTCNFTFDPATGWGAVILRNYAGGTISLGSVAQKLLKLLAHRPTVTSLNDARL